MILLYHQNNQCSIAHTHKQKSQTSTINTHLINSNNLTNTKINIQTEKIKLYLDDKKATFLGNVIIEYDDCILCANHITLYQTKDPYHTESTIVTGTGHIQYRDNIINIHGEKIWSNLNTKDINLYQGYYEIKKYNIHGTANAIKERLNQRYTTLKNATFTSCPLNKQYWKLTGTEFLYDDQKKTVNIWHAYFKLGKTPIFYLPYLYLPLKYTQNFSCYLPIPQYTNKNGIEIKLPYYFNYNKHYYGSINTNYIHKKGVQFQNKIHYSNILGNGLVYFDILNKNKLYQQSHYNMNTNYWLIYWKHTGTIHKKWYLKSDYIKISNPNYFYNLESKYVDITDNCFKKKLLCNYTNNQWQINISYKTFQILNDNSNNIYNTKPQININFYNNTLNPLTYHVFSQITKFTNINKHYPKTIRLHIEPSIYITHNNDWIHFNSEAKLQTTYYQQKNIDYYNNMSPIDLHLKNSVMRLIPQFKCNTSFILQKKNNILKKYQQILKLHAQYLYVPYHKQNNIALYDTTSFYSDNPDIFHDPIYTGLDRIISTNQLSQNITTTIYNTTQSKLLKISLGQIYYLTSLNATNAIQINNKYKLNKNYLIWTNSNYWYINNTLGINTNLQYNTQIKKIKSGNTTLELKKNINKILQINYRYINNNYNVNNKYTTKILQEPTNLTYQTNISQIGLISHWIIYDHWILSGANYYSIKNNKILNQIIGIRYNTCCWSITAGYEKNINILQTTNYSKKYDNKLLLNITLNGITNISKEKNHNILKYNTLPYNTIFYNKNIT